MKHFLEMRKQEVIYPTALCDDDVERGRLSIHAQS